MAVVYGAPIAVDKIEKPTEEQIDKLHANYVKEVETLWEKYKKEFPFAAQDRLVIT